MPTYLQSAYFITSVLLYVLSLLWRIVFTDHRTCISLCRIEESARALVVLDVDG